MPQLETLASFPIEAIYWQTEPNAPIDLGQFTGTLASGPNIELRQVSGNAIVRFLPKVRLQLEVPASNTESVEEQVARIFRGFDEGELVLQLDQGKANINVFHSSRSNDGDAYHLRRTPQAIIHEDRSIVTATFNIFNWPNFTSSDDVFVKTGSPQMPGFRRCGRIILKCEGWSITVAATENTEQACKELKRTGGFSVTHVGTIRREDGQPYSPEDLENVLSCLTSFFSFAIGRWSGPSLAIGVGEDDNRSYEEWGLRRCDDYEWRFAWCDEDHFHAMGEVLPGFFKLWQDPLWRGPLTETVYWYLNANRGGSGLGSDAALLFSQAALELLAWTYCVLDKKIATKNKFRPGGLKAAEKLRLLARSLDIPTEIPEPLTSLHFEDGKLWADSMDVITDLRNGLVHPDKDQAVPDGAYFDGWKLSMWYLDLVLLRLCGFNGSYANRLQQRQVGQVEPVPWKK